MKKIRIGLLFLFLLVAGCDSQVTSNKESKKMSWSIDQNVVKDSKHRVFYEIFVRSFADSNGDGIGDLNGVTKQLDYLKELGIGGIWLMPIQPSPSYHGYDVTDYYDVNQDYGTLADMKRLVEEAHKRDIKIVMDLVMNHTSNKHPWFQKALTGDPDYRDFYVWSDVQTNTNELGDWNQKIWHGESESKYEGIFWDGMPDLNYRNPAVMEEMKKIGSFWLQELDVDGFRLDAAKYLFSSHQVKDHHDKNAALWEEFKQSTQNAKSDSFLVGEIWDTPSIVGTYLHGLDSGFNFDLSSKILSSVKQEKDAGIASSLERTRAYFQNVSNEFVDSIFITNHDMNRVMSEVAGNQDQAKMAASLLFTLPGNPYVYYGEEIGLEGKKPDENIREPMIWSQNKDESLNTTWIKRKYSKNAEQLAVSVQKSDKTSLYNHYKTMISVRKGRSALLAGEIKGSDVRKQGLVSFERMNEEESLLVLHNITSKKMTITIPKEWKDVYFSSQSYAKKDQELILAPYSTIIFEKEV
ncbi:alpha-amylase family glycosyl hydrolase [Heyndrickxia sp. FSL W8-0496]|uniref:alpha-amylase family glycosyl hydrolase n=1 Tax=Heyndrickxia TaxID=2837504 RepID=UPI0030F6D276